MDVVTQSNREEPFISEWIDWWMTEEAKECNG